MAAEVLWECVTETEASEFDDKVEKPPQPAPGSSEVDPETSVMVNCPYDPLHRIRSTRVMIHLIKCRRNYENALLSRGEILPQLVTCKYNWVHKVAYPELVSHELACTDRHNVLVFGLGFEDTPPPAEGPSGSQPSIGNLTAEVLQRFGIENSPLPHPEENDPEEEEDKPPLTPSDVQILSSAASSDFVSRIVRRKIKPLRRIVYPGLTYSDYDLIESIAFPHMDEKAAEKAIPTIITETKRRALERRTNPQIKDRSATTKKESNGDLKAPSEAAMMGSSSNPKASHSDTPHDEGTSATPAKTSTSDASENDWDSVPGPNPMPYDPMQKFRDGPQLLYGKYPAGLSKSGRKLWTVSNLGKYQLFGEGILPFEPIVEAPNAPIYEALDRERRAKDENVGPAFKFYGSEEGQLGMALEKEASKWEVKKWLEGEETETETEDTEQTETESEQTETETEQTEAEDTETEETEVEESTEAETETEEVGDLMQWDFPEDVTSAGMSHPEPRKTAEQDLLDFISN